MFPDQVQRFDVYYKNKADKTGYRFYEKSTKRETELSGNCRAPSQLQIGDMYF